LSSVRSAFSHLLRGRRCQNFKFEFSSKDGMLSHLLRGKCCPIFKFEIPCKDGTFSHFLRGKCCPIFKFENSTKDGSQVDQGAIFAHAGQPWVEVSSPRFAAKAGQNRQKQRNPSYKMRWSVCTSMGQPWVEVSSPGKAAQIWRKSRIRLKNGEQSLSGWAGFPFSVFEAILRHGTSWKSKFPFVSMASMTKVAFSSKNPAKSLGKCRLRFRRLV
jgi:hypothetical protein